MGRQSLLFKQLTSDIERFPDEDETMRICETLLEQICRARSSDRKKKYKAQLLNVVKHLRKDQIGSGLIRQRLEQEKNEAEQAVTRQSVKSTAIAEQNARLETRLSEAKEWQARHKEQKAATRASEVQYSKLLREMEALESRHETLQKRWKSRQPDALEKKVAALQRQVSRLKAKQG